MFTSAMEDAMRVAAAIDRFERRADLTSAEFERLYAEGALPDVAWARAWHQLAALASLRPAEPLLS